MAILVRRLAALFALGAVCFGTAAQQYPSRPITLIVRLPPGGVTDVE